MPGLQITPMQAFHFMLLMCAIPAQYFLYEWMGNTEELRAESIARLVSYMQNFGKTHLTISSWRSWAEYHMMSLRTNGKGTKVKDKSKGTDVRTDRSSYYYEESVAEEVFQYMSPQAHFATSSLPRSPRPKQVKFRVGQVIRHKRFGYRGIIIGWDEVCKAPKSWIHHNHGAHEHWKNQPNYGVLVDTRDRKDAQITYVVQENMDVILDTKVIHPQVDDYFDFYDGAQYHMRSAMRKIYPHD